MALRASNHMFWPFGRQNPTSTSAETRSATARAREADLDAIERFYITPDRSAIRGFLMQRPFLVTLLFEAHQEIARFFSNSPLRLTLTADPENDDDHHLMLHIVTSLEPEQAIVNLQALDSAWWLDALVRAHHALSISIMPDEL